MDVGDTPPARPRRGRPATGVRAAILAAAEAVLAEAGAARLSTKEIARRAGVAESSIFYHFGDRIGLLLAVVQRHLPPVKRLLDGLGDRAGDPAIRDDLIALVDVLEGFFLHALPVLAAIEADGELRAAFTGRADRLTAGPHRAVDGVRAYLAERQAAGRLAGALDLDAAAVFLVGAAHQRALQRRLGPPEVTAALPTPDRLVDALIPPIVTPPRTIAADRVPQGE